MNEGFGRVTIDAVSARSGVGKPTLYRHWANASELTMAALMEHDLEAARIAGGPLADVLARQIGAIVQAFATTRGRQIGLAMAAADPESEMTRAFRNRVVLAGREDGRRLIEASASKGEIDPPRNLECVLDMIYSPVFYRVLIRHAPLDEAFARGLVEGAMTLLGRPSVWPGREDAASVCTITK